MHNAISVLLLLGLLCAEGHAGVAFIHDFDSDAVAANPPVGFGVFGGSVLAKGVTDTAFTSPSNSVFMLINFSINTFFAGVLLHDPLPSFDMLGGELSAQIQAASDFSGFDGVVGFQLEDSDGTVQRTQDEDLFVPTTNFQLFLQNVAE